MKVKVLKPIHVNGRGKVKVGEVIEMDPKNIEALLKVKAIEKFIKDK